MGLACQVRLARASWDEHLEDMQLLTSGLLMRGHQHVVWFHVKHIKPGQSGRILHTCLLPFSDFTIQLADLHAMRRP